MNEDNLFNTLQKNLVDFRFDEKVVNVFADMVKRSVPGYETMLQMLPLFAEYYGRENSRFYDLGCSLGAVSLALDVSRGNKTIEIIAVDNSPQMITACRHNLAAVNNVSILEQDITSLEIDKASVVVLNLTLQFIAPNKRQQLIDKIYRGLMVGGVLLISEKINDENNQHHNINNTLQLNFKRANGYSELAIAQKRSALEKVLIADSKANHLARFDQAGFNDTFCWFQCLNFASFLAIK